MKKVFLFVLTALITLQVVSLPVFASGTISAIPFDSMDAYAYFSSKGLTNFSSNSIPSNIVHSVADQNNVIKCGGASQTQKYADPPSNKYEFVCQYYSGHNGSYSEQNIFTMSILLFLDCGDM